MTIIKENDDGDKCRAFAQFIHRLLELAELFYQLLKEDLRGKRQCAEETQMHSEQTLYMQHDFDWEFQEDRR